MMDAKKDQCIVIRYEILFLLLLILLFLYQQYMGRRKSRHFKTERLSLTTVIFFYTNHVFVVAVPLYRVDISLNTSSDNVYTGI